jgi:LAO/AO transport system kinase
MNAEEVADLHAAVLRGERRALARTITLLESTRSDHVAAGQTVLDALVPRSGGAIRVGITGPPGVGKSTFIEALGLHLADAGRKLAVLAVDPSSPVTGGSILGDKTRMEQLARHPGAFIRPSPSGGSLGGVAERTREAMLACEAASHDVVLIETVGIGQSEVTVSGMVDFFLVLLQPGSGDELQGIKKGVLELADGLIVNKADGDLAKPAERTRNEFSQALHLVRPLTTNWSPRVLAASAKKGEGISEAWAMIEEQRDALAASGERTARRRDQARAWMWTLVDDGLRRALREHPAVASQIETLESQVEDSATTPASAARAILDAFRSQ